MQWFDPSNGVYLRRLVLGCEQAKSFFSQVGWNVQRVDNIQAVARKVAGPHVEFAFKTEPPTRPDQMNYRFFTATPARH